MSGGGGSVSWPTREDLNQVTREAQRLSSASTFGAELAGELGRFLGAFNDRDVGLVSRRVEEIRKQIEEELDCTIDVLYGGSVSKNTYVSGLSDIDSLFAFRSDDLSDKSPSEVLEFAEGLLKKALKGRAQISAGSLAITIEYPDGMVIQCLPAVKGKTNLRIASGDAGDRWSSVNPVKFQKALTTRNQECGSKLVPMIKLAKAICSGFPEELRLSGYHIEARAIQAFRGYQGEKTTAVMLPHFFDEAAKAILRPIKDSSGQSVHVDDDLGPANSEKRKLVSNYLSRVHRRMRNATASGDIAQWKNLFPDLR